MDELPLAIVSHTRYGIRAHIDGVAAGILLKKARKMCNVCLRHRRELGQRQFTDLMLQDILDFGF
jgi:hypothetical protein